MGHDIFNDYIDFSAFDDPTPDSELVAGSSTTPSPEPASDQDHHTGRPGPYPQISNASSDDTYDLLRPAVWKDIAGADTMSHQTQGWKWEGQMVAPSQPWVISSSDVETTTPAHTVVSTPTPSKPVDVKGGGKRARDDDTDAPISGVSTVPPLKKVNRRPPNEEPRKRDEQAEKVKTDEQAMAFFDPERTLRSQGLVQGPEHNPLQPGQLFNSVGPLVPPLMAQSISAFNIPSMGAQITGSNSNGGVSNKGGIMSGSMNPAAMKCVASSSFPIQSAAVLQIQRPTLDDFISAKRLVIEKKRMAFSCGQFSLLRLPHLSFISILPQTLAGLPVIPQFQKATSKNTATIWNVLTKYFPISKSTLTMRLLPLRRRRSSKGCSKWSVDLIYYENITTNTTAHIDGPCKISARRAQEAQPAIRARASYDSKNETRGRQYR